MYIYIYIYIYINKEITVREIGISSTPRGSFLAKRHSPFALPYLCFSGGGLLGVPLDPPGVSRFPHFLFVFFWWGPPWRSPLGGLSSKNAVFSRVDPPWGPLGVFLGAICSKNAVFSRVGPPWGPLGVFLGSLSSKNAVFSRVGPPWGLPPSPSLPPSFPSCLHESSASKGWPFKGVHEGSAFRFAPSKVSTKALPFVLDFPRCPRRLWIQGWSFNPSACSILARPSGSSIWSFLSKRWNFFRIF